MEMDYMTASIAIGIASLSWLAGCIFLYLGWRARKPDVYVDGEGAGVLNLTHANAVHIRGSATLPELHEIGTLTVYGGEVGMRPYPANVITDLRMDGGELRIVQP